MNLFRRLFVSQRSSSTPYIDAGTRLTLKIARSLDLEGWRGAVPHYTEEETEAINEDFTAFQRMANQQMGGEVVFHSEAAPEIRRRLAARSLHDLANIGWKFTEKDTVPVDWRSRVSTYLKAWTASLDPEILFDLAEMLTKVSHYTEAKEALQVVLLFPSYAHKYFGGKEANAIVAAIVDRAQRRLSQLQVGP